MRSRPSKSRNRAWVDRSTWRGLSKIKKCVVRAKSPPASPPLFVADTLKAPSAWSSLTGGSDPPCEHPGCNGRFSTLLRCRRCCRRRAGRLDSLTAGVVEWSRIPGPTDRPCHPFRSTSIASLGLGIIKVAYYEVTRQSWASDATHALISRYMGDTCGPSSKWAGRSRSSVTSSGVRINMRGYQSSPTVAVDPDSKSAATQPRSPSVIFWGPTVNLGARQ